MDLTKRVALWVSLVVFLIAATVYFITLTPTVPFWDSGEFIAVSYILGIPHPPGTPFYVMLGRLATMVPIASIAQRVNGLSALSSAFAVLFTYLVTLRLIRLAQGSERRPVDEWIAVAGAATGALLLAFSDNFWENSIEAEVYSMMSLAQILVLWLGLRWWEDHEQRPTAGPLLVCVYVMWLCVGLHLGVGMMGVPLLALVWLVDRRAALTFFLPLLGVLSVTFGLEKMLGVVLLLTAATFLAFAWQGKLDWWLWVASAVAGSFGLRPAFSDENFSWGTGALAAAAVLVPLGVLARRTREGRVLALALLLMVVGYSTHLYLPIRAAQHPQINEGNPSNWANLRDLLERKQYGHSSMFERRAPLAAQLDKEFWRYWKRQWPVVPGPRANSPTQRPPEPRWFQFALPMVLGLFGGFWQRRERVSFLTMLSLVAFATVGMIVFLNFTDHEVRDRDYFFTTGYHAYAIWIGLGVAWLVAWVRDSFTDPGQRWIAAALAAALLALQPVLLLRNLWFTHDRRGNYVAHDYAYDMLAPLAPGSYVFTNGDNDTFPLWYMQEVENFRRDVRVVNLSLLNTDWYIQQLRDQEPRVPIRLDDATVKLLGEGMVADSAGRPIMTNEWMVHHIIGQSRKPGGGWTKQPYLRALLLARGAGLPGQHRQSAGQAGRRGDAPRALRSVQVPRPVRGGRQLGSAGVQGRERVHPVA
ncbi:MAG: DUF2723 domain-containing protein [Candidatus Eisenbacteria bacterium]|uniref:DUF2723 domain-containing protein n=1 Tax=Eiseniibacteriota bacterium TaxID=2212470 RepID=A0A538U541_UNCEI|nr:MAG: DUF2723 domain-containing protein [Candidatus Eisenbacteria bacterium]